MKLKIENMAIFLLVPVTGTSEWCRQMHINFLDLIPLTSPTTVEQLWLDVTFQLVKDEWSSWWRTLLI